MLVAIWLVPVAQRSPDAAQVSQWDEAFHCALVAAAGNTEMARVHHDVTDRIRIIRQLDFTKPARIDATYDEHGRILKAIQHKRGEEAARLLRAHIETSQAEVRKITLHQVHMARQGGGGKAGRARAGANATHHKRLAGCPAGGQRHAVRSRSHTGPIAAERKLTQSPPPKFPY